jgi:hypothetical protein
LANDDRRRPVVRRREREVGGPRNNRFLLSYNDAELAIVRAAAERDNIALASWVGTAALDVAKEILVPVSADTKDVLQELIQSRSQLRRIGNNLNQVAHVLNADGMVTDAQLEVVLQRVDDAVKRVDEATLQVMRERRLR